MDRQSLGCAGFVLAGGALIAAGAVWNHQSWLQRQEQIPRFEKVRATVVDTGIAHYRSRGRTPSEDVKWVRFTCHIGNGHKDGARLTLSGSDEGWESFTKGMEYDAFYDRVVNECVLLVDEKLGEPDHRYRQWLTWAAVLAVAALVITLRAVIGKG